LFGFIVGSIFGVFRGKWSWGYATALGSWAILFVATVLAFIVQMMWRFFNRNKEKPPRD
jgi:cyanate permease